MVVGFQSGLLRDRERLDWDGTASRPVAWSAWYPVEDEGAAASVTVGGPRSDWFDLGRLARGAAPSRAGNPFPVVLISHGTGGTAASLGWLARRLAAWGVAVLAVDHHGNTATQPPRPEGFLCWWERARDLSLALDVLSRDGPLAGRLDEDRVGAAGFSLGCHTALALLGGITDMERFRDWAERQGGPLARGPREFPDLADRVAALLSRDGPIQAAWARRGFTHRDPRVAAAVLLAPAPPVQAFTDDSLATIAAPVHMLTVGADQEAPAVHGADWLGTRLRHGTRTGLADAAGHYVFLPEATAAGLREAPDLCRDAPGVNRAAIHEAAAAAVHGHLIGHASHDPAAQRPAS